MVLRYLLSLIPGVNLEAVRNKPELKTYRNSDRDAAMEFDYTNEEVQQLLQTDDELLENLEGMVEDDLAHLVYEDEEESHYAVLDIWWNQIARGLGHETPEEEDDGAFLVTLASTSAYETHSERVGEYPDVESNLCGTSPFVVEQ